MTNLLEEVCNKVSAMCEFVFNTSKEYFKPPLSIVDYFGDISS